MSCCTTSPAGWSPSTPPEAIPAWPSSSGSTAEYDHDPATAKTLVETSYAGSGWRTEEFLTAWRSAEDVYFDAITRIDITSWSRGRIALLGDAARCLSVFGDGSSNAIIAAKTIADALFENEDDHGAAFAEYEREHRRRVDRSLRTATMASHFLVPSTRPGMRLRNLAVKAISRDRLEH